MLASLLISGRDWLLYAVLFLVGALLLVAWGYLRASSGAGVRAMCAFLKLLGVLALAACLLEPLWSGQRAKPGANFFVLAADNSQGMQIKDRGEPRTRGERLHAMLADDKVEWKDTLEENFQLRRYLFDSRLHSTRDFSELIFDGRSSAIRAALRTIAERYRGQPLAGVLLFTDGNATDVPDGKVGLNGVAPVYPVVLGEDESIKDVAVQKVTVSQTSFEDAPVTVQAEALAAGYSGKSIVAELLDPAGRNVQEQSQRVSRDNDTVAFRFQLRPEKSGVSFYRVRASARDEREQFARPESSTEATLANNSRVIVVDRHRGPFRILYVSGRPNWEFKFLNRAVAEDDQVQLVGLIRIAKREPKFEFRGRQGESSNPLFRGFDRKTEETERYDQPVLVRLNTRDATELIGGFPKTPEELFGFHAVIIDDLEVEFFSHDQMSLLQKFVSERGGGLLMLGGADTFYHGKYGRTPVGDMLPVYLERAPEGKPPAHLRLALTREGWLQPWARLRGNEVEEQARLDNMPPFQILNPTRGVKPGASVIANVSDSRGDQYPALVVQRFGHGRVGALMVGDLWQWGLQQENEQRELSKAWRQMIRWLIADVPNRIDLHTEPKPDDADEAVLLEVRARDKKFQPLDNANVTINVRTPAGGQSGTATNEVSAATNAVTLRAEPALTEPGLYQATYLPRDTGGYLAEAVVTDEHGVEAGRAEAGWVADPAAEEFRSLKPNRALLEAIARQTGGEVIAADDLDAFARKLPNRKAPITESWSFPLWHQPAVFLFALACFVVEWGLRRWKGMA